MLTVQGFLECDEKMRVEESLKDEMAGSTAVVVLTQGKVTRDRRRSSTSSKSCS